MEDMSKDPIWKNHPEFLKELLNGMVMPVFR